MSETSASSGRRLGHRAGADAGERRARACCCGRASPRWSTTINTEHRNPLFLPSAALSPTIRATGDLAELADCRCCCWSRRRSTLPRARRARPNTASRDLVLCAKGIEAGDRAPDGRCRRDVAPAARSRCFPARPSRTKWQRAADRGDAGVRGRRGAVGAARHRSSPGPPSDPITPTMSPARKSAARSRTCSPSPAAWSRGWGWARMPAPR